MPEYISMKMFLVVFYLKQNEERNIMIRSKNTSWEKGCVMVAIMGIIPAVIGAIVNGWAFAALWGWFIVPIFSLPSLHISEAIGVALIVSFLTASRMKHDEITEGLGEAIANAIVQLILYPLISVSIGWIVYQFV